MLIHWGVVRPQAVQSHAENSKFLVTPVVCAIKMHLFLPTTAFTADKMVEQVRRGEGHEAYAVFELISDTNRLVLVEVERIVRDRCGAQ